MLRSIALLVSFLLLAPARAGAQTDTADQQAQALYTAAQIAERACRFGDAQQRYEDYLKGVSKNGEALKGVPRQTVHILQTWTDKLTSKSVEGSEHVMLEARCTWTWTSPKNAAFPYSCSSEAMPHHLEGVPHGIQCKVSMFDASGTLLSDERGELRDIPWSLDQELRFPLLAWPVYALEAPLRLPADGSRGCPRDEPWCFAPQQAGEFEVEAEGCEPVKITVARGSRATKLPCSPMLRLDEALMSVPDALSETTCPGTSAGHCYRLTDPTRELPEVTLHTGTCTFLARDVKAGRPFPRVECLQTKPRKPWLVPVTVTASSAPLLALGYGLGSFLLDCADQRACPASQEDSHQAKLRAAQALTGLGYAALGTGVVWLIVTAVKTKKNRVDKVARYGRGVPWRF